MMSATIIILMLYDIEVRAGSAAPPRAERGGRMDLGFVGAGTIAGGLRGAAVRLPAGGPLSALTPSSTTDRKTMNQNGRHIP